MPGSQLRVPLRDHGATRFRGRLRRVLEDAALGRPEAGDRVRALLAPCDA
jgi:hypothetical protein